MLRPAIELIIHLFSPNTVDYIIMHNVKLAPSCSLQFPYDDGANFTLCIMM